jgi:diaminopimelate epimerase
LIVMEIDFLKMQGCGEDVVVVDAARLPAGAHGRLSFLARCMLDRSFGVGGSALVVLGASDDADLSLRGFDPDGDEVPATGNSLRCAARYATDSGAAKTSDFSMGSATRRTRVQVIDSANIRVDMGVPVSREAEAEIRESDRGSFTSSLLVEGRELSYTPVSLGRPWAMLFVPDFSFPLKKTARAIAGQPEFPVETGVGFVQVISREEIRLRSWEDLGPEGLPGDECECAAAAVVASVVNGFTDREVFVRLRGGDVFIQWEEGGNRLWLTGPAGYVFTGVYDFPDEDKR